MISTYEMEYIEFERILVIENYRNRKNSQKWHLSKDWAKIVVSMIQDILTISLEIIKISHQKKQRMLNFDCILSRAQYS